jgi:hypothetical protein
VRCSWYGEEGLDRAQTYSLEIRRLHFNFGSDLEESKENS